MLGKEATRRVRFISLVMTAVAIIAALSVLGPAPTHAAAGFVGRSGTHFTLDGQPFYIAGTNSHYLGFGSHAEVDDMLTNAKSMNFNVVRTIMHSVRGSLDGTTKPTLWNWASTGDSSNMGMHGVYILYWDTNANTWAWNDSTVDGLGRWDYVLQKANQLGLKLDISLLDFWQWAGGMQQINAWYNPGYDMSGDSKRYTFFFNDQRTIDMYKAWVNHVLNRTNTLTGIKYKDDPTVFAWDLMNEPEVSSVLLAQTWIGNMSAYIKTIDTNHMVTSGTEGFYGGQGGSDPETELAIPSIDFGTWHTYPDYHKINGHNLTPADVLNLISQHCQTAANQNKPVLLQEFAYSSAHADQATAYQSWVNAIYNNPNCAGWLFWRLEGHVKLAPTQNFPAGESDPLTGYPPDNGEHFSLFNDGSASSTVFKNAAAQMVARNGPQPTATRTLSPTPTVAPAGTFLKGINMNGNAVTIEGNLWLSYAAAQSAGLSSTGGLPDTKSLTPSPATDADTTAMLNSLLYASSDPGSITLAQTLANGNYQVYLWVMENYQSNSRSFNVTLEGTQVASGVGNLPLNGWQRYGPYNVSVGDGVLNIGLVAVTGRAMIMGLAIYQVGGPTATPQPTATRTPTPGAATATRTATASPTAAATATRTPTATSGGTNIAPSGTGYRWWNLASTTSDYQKTTASGVNDGNMTADVELSGGSDDNGQAYQAAGVIWPTSQTITSVKFKNGSYDQYQNGVFTANFGLQFSTDGVTWTNAGWSATPAYAYDSSAAAGTTYTFTGTAVSNIKGVRVIGQVRTTDSSLSWHAHAVEVQVFN